MLDSIVGCEVVDGLPPPVLMIGGKWVLVGLFCGALLLEMEVSISFCFLIVVILVLLQLIELMDCLEAVIVFFVDGHVAGHSFVLDDFL